MLLLVAVAHLVFAAVLRVSDGERLADVMLWGAFAAVGLLQVVATLRWGAERLFLASDLELLLASPLPHRTLFASRILDCAASSPVSALIACAAGMGYATAHGSVLGMAGAVGAAALLALAATLPGLIVLLLLVRVVSPARLRTVSLLLPALVGVAFSMASSFIGSAVDDDRGARGLAPMLAAGDALRALPSSWPAELVRLSAGSAGDAAGIRLLLFTALALALCAVAYSAFRATSYVSWSLMRQAPARPRRGFLERLAPPLPDSLPSLVVKDWRTTFRDVRSLMGLFFPVGFAAYVVVRATSRCSERPPSAAARCSARSSSPICCRSC
jgi:hypothetical protein